MSSQSSFSQSDNPLYTDKPRWYSWKGRINQESYFFFLIGILFLEFSIFRFLENWKGNLTNESYFEEIETIRALAGMASILFIALKFIFMFGFVPRRLHDTDHDGTWVWLIFPVVVCAAGLGNRFGGSPLWGTGFASFLLSTLFLIPSTKGPNKYGPQPSDGTRLNCCRLEN